MTKLIELTTDALKNSDKDIIIEIEPNSSVKLEYHGSNLNYDRTLKIPMPVAYGTYISGKIQPDGDFLDVVLLDKDIITGELFNSNQLVPLAIIEFYDNNEEDKKIVYLKKTNFNKDFLNKKLYELVNYINYLYYYKKGNCYVKQVFLNNIIYEYDLELKTPLKDVTYFSRSELDLNNIIKELLA